MSRKMLVVVAIAAALGMLLTVAWPESSSESELSEGTDVPMVPSPPPLAAAGNAAPGPAAPMLAAADPVAEEDDAPPPAAEPEPPKQEHADMIEGDQGPVADYRKRYDSETRDAKAQEIETKVQTTFQRQPSELFQSVSCHQTICRVMLRWSAKRTTEYVLALRRLGYGGIGDNALFEIPLALSPVTPQDEQGVRTVELYLKRR